MPAAQPLKGTGGAELVGLSDVFARGLLAARQSQSKAAAVGWPLGRDSDCD